MPKLYLLLLFCFSLSFCTRHTSPQPKIKTGGLHMVLDMTFIEGSDVCDKKKIEKYHNASTDFFPAFGGSDEIYFNPSGKVFCTMNARDGDSSFFYYGNYFIRDENIICVFNMQFSYHNPNLNLVAMSSMMPEEVDIHYTGKSKSIHPFYLEMAAYNCPEPFREKDTLKMIMQAVENNYPTEMFNKYHYSVKLPTGENFLLSKIDGIGYWEGILEEAGLITAAPGNE